MLIRERWPLKSRLWAVHHGLSSGVWRRSRRGA